MFRRIPAVALIAAVLAIASACGGDDNSGKTPAAPSPNATAATTPSSSTTGTPTNYPIDVQRSDGKSLTLPQRPSRVVSLSPGATEIIYAIDAQDTLVAVDKQADYPDAAAGFATKVDAFEPNIEAITALNPDLVIVAVDTGGIVEALDRLNIPVLFNDLDTSIKSIDDVLDMIDDYGDIFDRQGKSRSLASSLRARMDKVADKADEIAPDTPLTVYHELDSTYYSVSQDTFIGSLYGILRVENIAGDGGGIAYPQLTQEAIIGANPSVIVLADEEFGVSIDSVKARPGWDATDAVKNNRIYAIDPDIISRPGPRILDALEQLAHDFYPDEFP